MFRGKNISTKPGEASEDEYEEDYDEENDHTYCTRQVSIKTSLDKDGEAEAENASLIEGSDGENTATNKVAGHDEGDQHDDEIENPPTDLMRNCFFRTLEACDKFVVVVAHDGYGSNYIYVYDYKLNILAEKKVIIKKNDHSFNNCAYIHKVQLQQRPKSLLIFGVSQKYEHKLFVFEYKDGVITTIKKYRDIHTALITDFHLQGNSAVSVGRDKKVNIFEVKIGS